jgi:hypothetical protein
VARRDGEAIKRNAERQSIIYSHIFSLRHRQRVKIYNDNGSYGMVLLADAI